MHKNSKALASMSVSEALQQNNSEGSNDGDDMSQPQSFTPAPPSNQQNRETQEWNKVDFNLDEPQDFEESKDLVTPHSLPSSKQGTADRAKNYAKSTIGRQQSYRPQPEPQNQKYNEWVLPSADDNCDLLNKIGKDDLNTSISTPTGDHDFGLGNQSMSMSNHYTKVTASKLSSHSSTYQSSKQRGEAIVLPEAVEKDPLEIVDEYEKMNDTLVDIIIEQASQLLSSDQVDNDIQQELMNFDDFDLLAALLDNPNEKYFGKVTCSGFHGQYYFVGNDKGFIRVFDLKSRKVQDLKPLFDKHLASKKVMCIDLSQNMEYLVAGYESGALALFDMNSYKLVKIMTEAHDTEVLGAKIYNVNEEKHFVEVVSVEMEGAVVHTSINTKGGIFDKSTQKDLITDRFKHPRSLAVMRLDERFQNSYWVSKQLVALGASTEVVICQMSPFKELLKVNRPKEVKNTAVPYLDFGVGLTPNKQDKTVPILAIAWGCFIQTIYFDQDEPYEIVKDGVYACQSELKSCHFTGDSILCITDQERLKIVYSRKLLGGDIKGQVQQHSKDLDQLLELSANSELDNGMDEVNEISRNLLSLVMYFKNKQGDTHEIHNCNNTVSKYGRHLLFHRQSTITKVSVYTHDQFLDKLYFEDSVSWLTLLKTALEIFNGNLTGFSDISDEKEARETELLPSMQQRLMDILQRIVEDRDEKEQQSMDNTYIEQCQIKAAIEFCLDLKCPQFLFQDVYEFFFDKYLQDVFVKVLEPFIMTGQFRKTVIPQNLVRKLVYMHEEKGSFQELEKMIKQLDWSQYGYLQELESLCQQKFLVSAVFHIQMSQEKETNKFFSCMKILVTTYKMMRQARDLESSKKLKNPKSLSYVKKEDLQILMKTDKEKKSEIEKSHIYIGYKLLWIIQMFLSGKRQQNQDLTDLQWRQYVYDIAHFLNEDEHLGEILDFDSDAFFRVITKLFKGRPWKFLSEMKKKLKNAQDVIDPVALLTQFQNKGKTAKALSKQSRALDNFYAFILYIANSQFQEQLKAERSKAAGKERRRKTKPLEIEYSLLLEAFQIVIKSQNQGGKFTVDEQIILGALRSRPLEYSDIESLFKLIEEQPDRHQFINVQIELYTNHKNYVQAFKCLLQSKSQQERVFEWINDYVQLLEHDQEQCDLLKVAVKVHMYDIAALEVEAGRAGQKNHPPLKLLTGMSIAQQQRDCDLYCKQTVQMIDTYFNDMDYIRNLVTKDFADLDQIQLHFLKTFTVLKQRSIQETIHDVIEQPSLQALADLYETFLTIFTRRLCELEPENVEHWVQLDYFPTRKCMEVCRQWRNFNGEALLMEKLGDGMKGISIYLNFMEKIDQKRLVDQLSALGNQPSDVGRLSHFEFLGKFDSTLEKASKIASKVGEDGKPVYGEDAWFLILEFLHRYKQSQTTQPRQVYMKEHEVEDRVKRLKDFIMFRIRYVLQRDGMDLSFRRVADRLQLEYEQIENLCKFKLENLIGDSKREIGACRVQELDLFHVFKDAHIDSTRGSAVKTRFDFKSKMYQSANVCWLCRKFLMNQQAVLPLESFGCGHVYHVSCLKDRNSCFACDRRQILFDEDEFHEYQMMMREHEQEETPEIAQMNCEYTLLTKQRTTQRALTLLDTQLQNSYLMVGDF